MWNSLSKGTDAPLRVGLTGGIGSGKSLVCQLFRLLGISIFDADQEAKLILSGDNRLKEQLTSLFGSAVYSPEGILNRQYLASLLFTNPIALQQVNALVHPLVKGAFEDWYRRCKGPYVLLEAAILFESGFHTFMDASILVTAPEFLRINRVMKRDGLTEEKVLSRINNQWKEDETRKLADYIIRNDGTELVFPQVLSIDNLLRKKVIKN